MHREAQRRGSFGWSWECRRVALPLHPQAWALAAPRPSPCSQLFVPGRARTVEHGAQGVQVVLGRRAHGLALTSSGMGTGSASPSPCSLSCSPGRARTVEHGTQGVQVVLGVQPRGLALVLGRGRRQRLLPAVRQLPADQLRELLVLLRAPLDDSAPTHTSGATTQACQAKSGFTGIASFPLISSIRLYCPYARSSKDTMHAHARSPTHSQYIMFQQANSSFAMSAPRPVWDACRAQHRYHTRLTLSQPKGSSPAGRLHQALVLRCATRPNELACMS